MICKGSSSSIFRIFCGISVISLKVWWNSSLSFKSLGFSFGEGFNSKLICILDRNMFIPVSSWFNFSNLSYSRYLSIVSKVGIKLFSKVIRDLSVLSIFQNISFWFPWIFSNACIPFHWFLLLSVFFLLF